MNKCAHGIDQKECVWCGHAPKQEPVAWMWKDGTLTADPDRADGTWTPLYIVPPQRKPLTHPQIHELDWPDGVSFEDILLFARAIEAAHGIKETNRG
jgi:hypothetical protein